MRRKKRTGNPADRDAAAPQFQALLLYELLENAEIIRAALKRAGDAKREADELKRELREALERKSAIQTHYHRMEKDRFDALLRSALSDCDARVREAYIQGVADGAIAASKER